jgi:predicted  nucleic acid-binding Zn-ribbon protein
MTTSVSTSPSAAASTAAAAGHSSIRRLKDQRKRAETPPEVLRLMDDVNVLMRRLRMLEERYSSIQKKNQLTDQNMLANQKKVSTEIKTINMEIDEIKADLAKLKETLSLVIQELKECAKKEDIAVLEKYLSLGAVKFVTQNQVERIVRDILDSSQADSGSPQPKSGGKPAP